MTFVRILVALLALILVATIAFGQEGQLPGQQPDFPNYLPEDFVLPLTEPSATAPAKMTTINVENLPRTSDAPNAQQALAGASVGAASFQALPVDLWRRVSAEHVTKMLQRFVDKGLYSLAARDLLRRLMVVDVPPPQGISANIWLARRAEVLLSLNLAEDAYNLLQGIQPADLAEDGGLAQTWAVVTLLAGEADRACGFIRQQVLNNKTLFWRQSLMVCQSMQGEAASLRLSLNLLGEEERAQDAHLVALLQAVLEDEALAPVTAETVVTPLQAVLYASYPGLMTSGVLPKVPDMMLRRVMATKQLPLPLRIEAGEHLVNRLGRAQDTMLLAQLYDTMEFDLMTVKDPLRSARQETSGPRARALLWQAAALGNLISTRAQALQALWQRARADGLARLPAALMPSLRNIQAHPNLAWFAPDVIRIALRNRQPEAARNWWRILQANRTLSEDLVQKRSELAVAFAYLDNNVREQTLDSWWQARNLAEAGQHLQAQRALAVLDATGIAVPVEMWRQLHQASGGDQWSHRGPGHVWLRLLATQLGEKNTGAALLMLLEPLIYTPAQQMAPQSIANIVTGFNYLGFEQLARQLALEALLPLENQAIKDVAQPVKPAQTDTKPPTDAPGKDAG
jgi:hypothetical protein